MAIRLSRLQMLLAKMEASYGVNPAAANTDAKLVYSLNLAPTAGNMIPRARAYSNFGQSQQGRETPYQTLSFDFDCAGSGSAGTAPPWGPFMRMCGCSETITAGTKVIYTPISSAFESTWMDFNWAGVKHSLGGSRGTLSMKFDAGKEPTFSVSATGLYNPPSDAVFTANTATTLKSFVDPNTFNDENTNFSFDNINSVVNSATFALGNKVVFNDKPNRVGVDITDRAPTGSIVVEADSVAAADYVTLSNNKTVASMTLTHGTVGGNIVVVNGLQVQLGVPSYTDVNGVLHYTIPLIFVGGPTDDTIDFTVK